MNSKIKYSSVPTLLHADSQSSLQNENIKFHHHPGPEIILIREGTCQIQIKDKTIEGKKGSLIIIPSNLEHNHINLGEMNTRTYCWFTEPALEILTKPLVMNLEEDSWIVKWMDDLVKIHREDKDLLNQVGGGILISILQLLKQLKPIQKKLYIKNFILFSAITYIEENLSKNISVNELAKTASLSASQFATIFKKEIGTGPIAFQQQLRMHLAVDLLIDPHKRISEIATQCGYENANYFARIFRKKFNCSPQEWRTKNCS